MRRAFPGRLQPSHVDPGGRPPVRRSSGARKPGSTKKISRPLSGRRADLRFLFDRTGKRDRRRRSPGQRGKGDADVLSGEKSGITAIMDADFALVIPLPRPAMMPGRSAVLSCREACGRVHAGVRRSRCHAIVRGLAILQNVEIPERYRIGEEGKGFRLAMRGFDISRIFLCLEAIAPALVSLQETMEHVKGRTAFGRPLALSKGIFPDHRALQPPGSGAAALLQSLMAARSGTDRYRGGGHGQMDGTAVFNQRHPGLITLHGHYGYTKNIPSSSACEMCSPSKSRTAPRRFPLCGAARTDGPGISPLQLSIGLAFGANQKNPDPCGSTRRQHEF